MIRKVTLLTLSLMIVATTFGQQGERQLVVQTKNIGAPIQNTMYGLFFEDINFGADGGLYGELIKNRSFDFPQNLMGWNTFGNIEVVKSGGPFERNPNYVRLCDAGHLYKYTGLENGGFRGIGVKKEGKYEFSFWGRAISNLGRIRVDLVGSDNEIITTDTISVVGNEWKKYELAITSPKTDAKTLLRIFLDSPTAVDMEHISLFPTDTWRGRKGGLRKDLAQALYDLKPGLFRFPGGCIVEGTDLETRYDWKKSVGAVENRPLNENRWHYTFPHRFFPDYFQSYGLGFYEYFLLSEDIGAEPLPVVSCGLACQFQNNSMSAHVAMADLDCYVQDALDLIEFANGSATTKWGSLRAQMGHPAPFNLKYLGVGNEQWGAEYPQRLEVFVKSIRKAYPTIQIVGSSGPSPDGKDFDYLWPEMKRIGVELVDEHYYRSPEWFLANATRYDSYDRKAPKVFAGEYACHTKSRKNSSYAALCEAAFMTGMERNADVVYMTAYAPLFAHVDGWQWRPDLIWFDNLSCVRTPSYYVQQMYATNAGTNVLSLTESGRVVAGEGDLYASSVWDKNTNEIIIKIANTGKEAQNVNVVFSGLKKGETVRGGKVTVISVNEEEEDNTIQNPNRVVPSTINIEVNGAVLKAAIPAMTFKVYRLSTK